MKTFIKIVIVLSFAFPTISLAKVARLGGFTYNVNEYGSPILSEQTLIFNESGMMGINEYPEIPFYLNPDDLSDARFNVQTEPDRYVLPPVYSNQQLYDMQNHIEEGEIEYYDDEPIYNENNQTY